ncbi:unnamed protein product [Leptidea sinapis]|nr:unnamed protein product [Leptidea sinapis]
MYAPSKQGEQPSVEVSKEFMMSPNKLYLEASLDKRIKVSVRQFADICLFSTAQYKWFTLSKVFTLTPLLANNKDKVADPAQRENLGIIVQYKVKVKLCLGPLGGDLSAELPFILMHPKPEEECPRAIADPPPPDADLIQLDPHPQR